MLPTIILPFAESLPAPEVTWSLVDHGFSVIALSRRGRSSALRHSRFARVIEVTPPASDFEMTIADFKSACANAKESSVPVALMPLDDEAVWLCEHGGLANYAPLIGPRGTQAELALNKQKQIDLAQTSGFFVPATTYVQRREDIPRILEFPVVFKPALAVTVAGKTLSKGRSWTCSDRRELESAVEDWGGRWPMLLQKFIAGVGEGLFGLATPRGVMGWSGHKRVRMMNPEGSGSSACRVAPDLDEASKAAAERFIQRSGWDGLFMIEMLRDSSGKPWFIELNGRAWGSMALARRSGLEYPAWAAQAVLEPETILHTPQNQDKSLVCRHLGRELLHLLFVLRGPRSTAVTAWPSGWETLSQLCRFKPQHRWYNWRRDDPKVFLADVYRTVHDQVFKRRQPR